MALNLAQKQAIVAEVSQVAQNALSLVTADYRGLTSGEMMAMRAAARKAGVHLVVVRNTLAKRALKETEFASLEDKLVGPTLLAFSHESPGDAARLLKDFVKQHDKLSVKNLSVGSTVYDAAQLDAVAALPTRDEALAKLMSAMQAPITKFVRTLSAPQEKLVRTFAALREQKQEQA